MQSNVDLAVLDSGGKVIHWFDGFRHQNFRRREPLGQYTVRELIRAAQWLDQDTTPLMKHPMKLPDLTNTRGIRLFVVLNDNRMKVYQTPVVEVVSLESDDWKPLAQPQKESLIDVSSLKKWLSQIYPPGIMERTNPRTKRVYKIQSVKGRLSMIPAGRRGKWRYALCQGQICLTDEGEDEFSYEGKLEMVLTYQSNDRNVHSLRGVFDGLYPRYDRHLGEIRWIPLQAAFESRPK